MSTAAAAIGWFLVVVAGVLSVLGIASWPPGGLMFALPFVFLIPAILLGLIGGALLWLAQRRVAQQKPLLSEQGNPESDADG